MKNFKNLTARVTTATLLLPFLVAGAHAQTSSSGIDAALDAVDLGGVATKVGAAALVVIAIALVFKGPDLAKRVIRKV